MHADWATNAIGAWSKHLAAGSSARQHKFSAPVSWTFGDTPSQQRGLRAATRLHNAHALAPAPDQHELSFSI